MKENKKIMDEKIYKIGQTAIECLNNRKFNKVILGLIIINGNENDIKNMELFYRDLENKLIYLNHYLHSAPD